MREILKCCFLLAACAVCAAAAQGTQASTADTPALRVPVNIVTRDVPPVPQARADRLRSYANARGASLAGWHGESLLIYTRFSQAIQLHRVSQPLGYREQLTFLDEPLAGATIPKTGARERIILQWDEGGSEFDQLFLFDLASREAQLLSDGKSLYSAVIWAPDERRFVYVTTQRNGRNWDIHLQDLDGNVERLLETESGFWFPIDWSPDGRSLLVRKRVSVNEAVVYELDVGSGELRPLVGADAPVSVGDAAYDGHGGVLFSSDEGSEFLRLHRLDLGAGTVEVLTPNVNWNVEGFELSAGYDKLAYVTNENGLSKLAVWSLPERKPLAVAELPAGIVGNAVFSPSGDQLGLTLNSATSASDVYVVNLEKGSLRRWTESETGGLDPSRFVAPELIGYPSFDGRQIPAFVYRPQTPGPHPVILLIHGGPEAQYRPRFSSTIQAYVNELNAAVIAPNVRGSNGYGKTYLKLDNGRLREDSVKDIGALLDWIEEQDDLDAERVAVTGGSYGGYMVLASMVHYGKRLAAAVEAVGISSFVTFLENTQPYRQDMRRVEYGDERDPEMRAFLNGISPLHHVDKMITPVLITQGANDPRVPASESEQIREALDEAGVPVWYVLARDEGHGFRKKVNRDYERAVRFAFLETYLRAE